MESIERINYDTLVDAMIKRNMVAFTYMGNDGKKKIVNVEPFMIVVNDKTKNIMLSAYFKPTTEQSIDNQKEDWKMYLLKSIASVNTLDIPFTASRDKYNPTSNSMGKVLYAVPKI